VFALGVELDQGLGGVAAHRIAGARSPDGLAVELEVAVARRRSVRVQVSVDGSLRSGSHLRAAVLVEGREAHSTTIDPAQIRCRKNRPQRRRVVLPDHISGLAIDQYQVLLGATRSRRELARYQNVIAVEGHVPHLRTRASKLR
jgi:hypothetical protein